MGNLLNTQLRGQISRVWKLSVPAILQCSGNMVTPSILNAIMCVLDVIFNAFLIPRYAVLGASLGTALSVVVISISMFWRCCFCSDSLRINRKESCQPDISILQRAFKIGAPVGAEQIAQAFGYSPTYISTDMPVKAVAYALGYEGEKNFIKFFT